MNRKLKKALKTALKAPAPIGKDAFLGEIPAPSIGYFAFVRSQASYIRKWIWALSALIFSVALIGTRGLEKDILWCVAALMPILALAVVTESRRSERCGMAELELSARFSLRSVLLSRLAILGVANLILMCFLVPIIYMHSGTTLWQTGAYILCPYLLTTFSGLWVMRKIRSKEAVYLCVAIAAGISIMNLVLNRVLSLYEGNIGPVGWFIALIVLAGGTLHQCAQMLKQTEELPWN